jgi:hypothetical protein
MRTHAHAGIPLELLACAAGATLPGDAPACAEVDGDGVALLLDGVDAVRVKCTAPVTGSPSLEITL